MVTLVFRIYKKINSTLMMEIKDSVVDDDFSLFFYKVGKQLRFDKEVI